jgi:hypothetical protein
VFTSVKQALASVGSVETPPVSLSLTQSLQKSIHRLRSRLPGSCSRSQETRAAGDAAKGCWPVSGSAVSRTPNLLQRSTIS